MKETKKQRKARLKREGRWNAFLERRRELVEDEGMSPHEAMAQLSVEFAPIQIGDVSHRTDTQSGIDQTFFPKPFFKMKTWKVHILLH